MPDALTVSAPVVIATVCCPRCEQPMQVMGDLATCANGSCEVFGRSWTVEPPKVDVVLREYE
jgi:hypothetical protein